MSVGLLALLDDVAAFAKVAAASIDDVAGAAAKASAKAAGAVIDDTAVTPNYVAGFTADRELPLIARIAIGSIRNKLLFLLPAALLLSLFLPWAISPLLALGGAYLCYEGAEKIYEGLFPHAAHALESELEAPAVDPKSFEDARVAGAIQTDFILSAEIMTIALATVPELPFWQQAAVLAVVGVAITLAVYGVVALIVKADDIGLSLARHGRTGVSRGFGRGLVVAVPYVMQFLGVVGTAAMIWVGGGIVVHGLAQFGVGQVDHFIEAIAHAGEELVPAIGGILHELVVIGGDFVFGLALGAILIPVVTYVIAPILKAARRLLPRGKPDTPAAH